MTHQDIADKINNKVYTSVEPYVRIVRFIEPTAESIVRYLKEHKDLTYEQALAAIIIERKEKEKQTTEAHKKYNLSSVNKLSEFFKDLEALSGIEGSPLLKPLTSFAWAHGHSAGYHGVLGVFEDLLESFKDIIDNYNIVAKKK